MFFILVAPKLEIDAQYEGTVQVKGGTSLILPVNMSGVPTPAVTWLHNNKPVAMDTFNIETGARHTTLKASNSTKALAGSYKVMAENEVGSDTADFTVNVKGGLCGSCLRSSCLALTGGKLHVIVTRISTC